MEVWSGEGARRREGPANGQGGHLGDTEVTNGQEQNRNWKENLTFWYKQLHTCAGVPGLQSIFQNPNCLPYKSREAQ